MINEPQADRPETAHADLATDRLYLVGTVLAAARDSARRDAVLERGDDAWSIGCTAYVRSRTGLVRLQERHTDWLSIVDPGMEFQFKIGVVPVRFYHGDSYAPSARHSTATQHEIQFPDPMGYRGEIYRLAVETGDAGLTTAVRLVRLFEGKVNGNWAIWLPTMAATESAPQGKELPPPTVHFTGEDPTTDKSLPTGTGDDV